MKEKNFAIGRSPEWRLKVLHKVTGEKSIVGSGWDNPDGSISIRVNLTCVLTNDPNLIFTLFKRDQPTIKKTT